MDELMQLAEALHLPKLRILALADYFDGLTNLLLYLDHLEEQVSGVHQAARRLPLESPSPVAWIASAALEHGRFRVSVQPLLEGVGDRRCHYSDLIYIRPANGDPITDETKAEIESSLKDELTWFGAGFADNVDSDDESRYFENAVRITVPRFIANRQGSGTSLPGIPLSLAVIGGHWAGAADVASFLGFAFDYDYSYVNFAASRIFSRHTHRWDDEFRERDRLEVVRTYIEGSEIGRARVWAADVGGSAAAARMLAEPRRKTPFIIYLKPCDELLEWTALTRQRLRHTDKSQAEDLRAMRVARQGTLHALNEISDKALVLEVPLPTSISERRPVKTNGGLAFFDLWQELAEDAIFTLHRKYNFRFNRDRAIDRLRNCELFRSVPNGIP